MTHKPPQSRPTPLDYTLAVIAALCGCALAVAHLIFKPVETAMSLPPAHQRDASRVYYIPGSRDSAKGSQWVRKRRQILAAAPGEITLTEDELNAWFSASTHVRQARKSSRAAGEFVEIGQPDFRIADGLMQIATPATLRLWGSNLPLVVQLRGNFARTSPPPDTGLPDVVMYVPQEIFAGALPLHRIPGAADFLANYILESQTLPGEAIAAWRKIARAEIAGRELRITISATAK